MINLFTQITENGKTVTYYETSDYITFAVFGLIFLVLAVFIIKIIKSSIKSRKEMLEELEKPLEDAPITEINARVLKKECFVKTYGTKMPETKKEFYITFSTFTGETKCYSVSEELYLSVDEGTVGTIAIMNDNFFDFYFEK